MFYEHLARWARYALRASYDVGAMQVLDTEARDGKLMRETGAAAAQTFQRRQNWRLRHQAMAQVFATH